MIRHDEVLIAGFLLALAVIFLASAAFAGLARKLRQPAVIGEIIAGLALGPSLLGQLPGNPVGLLFPADVRSMLNIIAQLGIVLFMFLVGYELDLGKIHGGGKVVATTSAASVIVPFGLGFGLALLVYTGHSTVHGHRVSETAFALFIGTALAITAFPVLARVISAHRMQRHPLGVLSMLIAAVNDVVAWCLLLAVVTLTSATGTKPMIVALAGVAGYAAVMTLLVRPLLRRFVGGMAGRANADTELFVLIVVGLLLSAWATAVLGLHPVFGAFLFGALTPRAEVARVAPHTPERVGQLSGILLPVFFVVTGLSVDIHGLGWTGLLELGAVVVVACVGKFAAAVIVAPLTRMGWGWTVALGALLNTRGLTELIVLGIGLQLGVLDDRMFTIMVLTAVITTVVASPLLAKLIPPGDDASLPAWAPSPAANEGHAR